MAQVIPLNAPLGARIEGLDREKAREAATRAVSRPCFSSCS